MNFEPASCGTSPGASAGTSTGASPSNPSLRPRSQTGRHLRALSLADISADCHDGYGFLRSALLSIPCTPLALGAFAIASALATQRLPGRPRGGRLAAVKARHGVSREGRPSRRPSGRPSRRLALSPKAGLSPACRHLLALRFADISTSPKGRCMSAVRSRYLGVVSSPSTAYPSTRPSPPRWLRSACSAEPLASTGAAWCGAVVPLVACLAMARRPEDCQQARRVRVRAQSARVMAVRRSRPFRRRAAGAGRRSGLPAFRPPS